MIKLNENKTLKFRTSIIERFLKTSHWIAGGNMFGCIFVTDETNDKGENYRRYATTNGHYMIIMDDHEADKIGGDKIEGFVALQKDKKLSDSVKESKGKTRKLFDWDSLAHIEVSINAIGEGDKVNITNDYDVVDFQRFIKTPDKPVRDFVMFNPKYIALLNWIMCGEEDGYGRCPYYTNADGIMFKWTENKDCVKVNYILMCLRSGLEIERIDYKEVNSVLKLKRREPEKFPDAAEKLLEKIIKML